MISFNEESKKIRENRLNPESAKPHAFKAAKWTHPNGHPRCFICGDEEPVGGQCNMTKDLHVTAKDFKTQAPTAKTGDLPDTHYMDIRDIYPNPWNRKLSREKIDSFKQQIRDMGQVAPLTVTEVDKRGKKVIAVTDGHHRLEALKEMGHTGKVPVVWADERGTKTAAGVKPKSLKKGVEYFPTSEQLAGRQQPGVKKPLKESTQDLLRNLAGEVSRFIKQMVIEAPVSGLSLTREDLGVRRRKQRRNGR